MFSNSKLTKDQKKQLKQFRASNPGVVFFGFRDLGVTVAITETGQYMGKFAVSIASPDETKFRDKVGMYNAAMRFVSGNTQPVRFTGNMGFHADSIAQAVSGD